MVVDLKELFFLLVIKLNVIFKNERAKIQPLLNIFYILCP